ncbi:MAG: SEC-C domain-containing protein [Christensenellaceae bacterium]|nr:SEC-C domain-containing protein [Christensenellaceae bacterium]
MALYEQWTNRCEAANYSAEMQAAYWNEYFNAETQNYKKILANSDKLYEGTLAELAKEFDMEPVVFCGFIDGINSSLVAEYDLDTLEEDSAVALKVDFEKLYYNMLDAKAKWLYELGEWEGVLSVEKRKEITKTWRLDHQAVSTKTVGRNDPCPCGSGKKYKKCCGK